MKRIMHKTRNYLRTALLTVVSSAALLRPGLNLRVWWQIVKVAFTASIVIFALALPAAAQDRTADVAQAKADLERAGVPLTKQCGAARIANLVAWRLRPQYGLLGKNGGNRAVLRADGSCENGGGPGDTTQERGVATDYLIDVTTKFGFDLLGDSGTDNTPHWQGPETAFIDRNNKEFTEPIDPAVYMGAPVVVTPPVVVAPAPPPALVFDGSALDHAIANLRADLDAHREEFQAFRAEVHNWKAQLGEFMTKYILPELGTILATLKLTGKM
jgi:hypothetical protein